MKRKRKGGIFAGLALWVFLSGVYSCTESDIDVKQNIDVKQVDDQLEIKGQVCTEPPDNTKFPVKIMFVMDCSGSLQQTDEGDHRVEAVKQVVRRYASNPQVSFDIIRFNGTVTSLTKGFRQVADSDDVVFGANGLLQADSMTDYEGALAFAFGELLYDMQHATLADLSRTKYVVIFFSDGTPDPVCYGCSTDQNSPRFNEHCSQDLHIFCNSSNTFLNEMNLYGAIVNTMHIQGGFLPSLQDGTDYNNDYQIFGLLGQIMDLKKSYHVGDLRFNTAFLYCRDQFGNPTSALCAAAEQAYDLDPDRGRALLGEMAQQGNGTFTDFTSGQDINFLNIDYTSIKTNYIAKNLIVTNLQAVPKGDKFLPDSDGDGLSDDDESKYGTDPLAADTDNDGYRDIIEIRYSNAGYDPLDANLPTIPCAKDFSGTYPDDDYDGLSNCEEALLGTDPNLVDTDKDGFPDLIEVLMGADPTRDDTAEDLDADGHRNGDELLFHTDPTRADDELWNKHRYWYEMHPVASEDNDRQCYEFDIKYITLVTTLQRRDLPTRGYNDIMVWFDQASNDEPQEPGRFKVACVRAVYVEPDYKVPVSGQVTLKDTDFVSIDSWDWEGSGCVDASNSDQ